MKQPLHNIKRETDRIRLGARQKSAMRATLLAHMGVSTPTPSLLRSPYAPLFYSRYMRAFAAALLFVLVGAGTASAAQGSLPGDLLYPVKVSINERVEAALAPSTAAKAAVEASLATRRVEEAETLVAQGRLDATTSAQLAANFDAHAQAATELADAAAQSDPGAAQKVSVTLASALSAHGEILQKLSSQGSSESSREHGDALAARVIARATAPARVAAAVRTFAVAPQGAQADLVQGGEATISAQSLQAPKSEQGDQKVAANLEDDASEVLSDAKALYKELMPKLASSTQGKIEAQFARADTSMSAGSASLGAQEYAAASVSFKEALGIATELETLLKAQKKYDKGLIRSLFNRDERPASQVDSGVDAKVVR